MDTAGGWITADVRLGVARKERRGTWLIGVVSEDDWLNCPDVERLPTAGESSISRRTFRSIIPWPWNLTSYSRHQGSHSFQALMMGRLS